MWVHYLSLYSRWCGEFYKGVWASDLQIWAMENPISFSSLSLVPLLLSVDTWHFSVLRRNQVWDIFQNNNSYSTQCVIPSICLLPYALQPAQGFFLSMTRDGPEPLLFKIIEECPFLLSFQLPRPSARSHQNTHMVTSEGEIVEVDNGHGLFCVWE